MGCCIRREYCAKHRKKIDRELFVENQRWPRAKYLQIIRGIYKGIWQKLEMIVGIKKIGRNQWLRIRNLQLVSDVIFWVDVKLPAVPRLQTSLAYCLLHISSLWSIVERTRIKWRVTRQEKGYKRISEMVEGSERGMWNKVRVVIFM